MSPHFCIRSLSTTNVTPSWSRVESCVFGSSRANPKEGPDHPPCIRATRMGESILFSVIYDFKELIASSVTSSIAWSSICTLLRECSCLCSWLIVHDSHERVCDNGIKQFSFLIIKSLHQEVNSVRYIYRFAICSALCILSRSTHYSIATTSSADRYGPAALSAKVSSKDQQRQTVIFFPKKKFILWELFSGQAVLLFEYNKFTLFLLPY